MTIETKYGIGDKILFENGNGRLESFYIDFIQYCNGSITYINKLGKEIFENEIVGIDGDRKFYIDGTYVSKDRFLDLAIGFLSSRAKFEEFARVILDSGLIVLNQQSFRVVKVEL
jgi:hypothetical protein